MRSALSGDQVMNVILREGFNPVQQTKRNGNVLICPERGCVADQPQHCERAAADALRIAALRANL
jgi:hypothetical protein